MCLVPSTVLQLWGVEPHKKPKNKPSFLKVTHHNDSCLITFLQLQLNTQCFWIFKTFLINFPPCLRQHPVSSDAREHQTCFVLLWQKHPCFICFHIKLLPSNKYYTEPRVYIYVHTEFWLNECSFEDVFMSNSFLFDHFISLPASFDLM